MVEHTHNLSSCEAIVQDYITVWRELVDREQRYYTRLGSLENAITCAGMAEYPCGKRHIHQRLISGEALEKATQRLLQAKSQIAACTTFDALIELVDQVTADIKGYGELTVYDTAMRIGAYLKLEPDKIYLHTGTRDGAKALGLDGKRKTINVGELPEEFRQLKPHEIEDVLCIYKEGVGKVADGR